MRTIPLTMPLATMAALLTSTMAAGQSFKTGQRVYAAPSGASNDWYSDCIVGSGRSNSSYQVECAGTTYWIGADRIAAVPPRPVPDPMRPTRMLKPVITPSHPAAAGGRQGAPVAPPRVPADATGAGGAGHYAGGMARRIQQDGIDAANAAPKVGKYSCYAGRNYTFSDLYITGPHSYTVKPGGSGSYSFANGVLTFRSGPYAGAYSRMVDGRTIGLSSQGSTNLGTQCGLGD